MENKSDSKASNHGRLSAFLRRQPLLIEAYRLLHPRRRAWALRDYKDYIYHGPNFYLPHRPERAVTTFHDISIFTCPEYHPKDRVRYMEKSLHESPDSAKLILTVSDFSRSEIIRLFNYPADRIVTTKLACSSDYIPRSPAECLPVLQKYQLAWQGMRYISAPWSRVKYPRSAAGLSAAADGDPHALPADPQRLSRMGRRCAVAVSRARYA